jgi:hypothetical protein
MGGSLFSWDDYFQPTLIPRIEWKSNWYNPSWKTRISHDTKPIQSTKIIPIKMSHPLFENNHQAVWYGWTITRQVDVIKLYIGLWGDLWLYKFFVQNSKYEIKFNRAPLPIGFDLGQTCFISEGSEVLRNAVLRSSGVSWTSREKVPGQQSTASLVYNSHLRFGWLKIRLRINISMGR